MTLAQLARLDESEAEGILRWLFMQLIGAGYGAEDAVELATRTEVDLHLATDLLHRGCPPKTAKRILL